MLLKGNNETGTVLYGMICGHDIFIIAHQYGSIVGNYKIYFTPCGLKRFDLEVLGNEVPGQKGSHSPLKT